MRNTALGFAFVVLVALGAGTGWYWWTAWRFQQSTDDAYVQSDITVISPKVEGYIKEVRVEENQQVAAGQVLIVVDDRDFAARAAQAEAAVATEEAIVATYASRLGSQQAMIEQATATVQSAEADLNRAQLDYKRYTALVTSDFASRQRYETAGNRAGRVGQYVKPGTQLLSLVPLPYVYVTANFKETQLTHMRPGQSAEISVDAYPDQPLTGRIESFAPASGAQFSLLPPDNATGNFTKIVQRVPVRIALPAEGPLARLLRPGLSVSVTVDTRAEPSPATAGAQAAEPGATVR